MKNKFQSFVDGMTLGGGSIQHPLSIHSASIGTRWKRRVLQVLMTMVILFTLGIGQMWAAASTKTYSFASSAELSNLTYTAGDASDSWAVCTSKTNSVSPRDGGFVQYKCGKSGKTATFVTTQSFDNISNIAFYIASSDKGKTQVKVEISSKADFSSDVTEIVNATGGLSGLGISSPSNNTWYSVSLPIATAKSGYVRFTMTASSSGKYWSYDDIVITYTPNGGGGGSDPVDPEFTYTPATYTIGDPALDLSTKLTSTNTTGAITFAISTADAGTTGASIASSKNFTATAAGTAKVTVSQAASTGYNAKSQDIDVTVVEPDTKCFNMPEITSKPADLASVTVTGGTLSDVSTAKSVGMNANGLKLDGNSVYLKVTLASASIVEGTKITVAWKGAGDGAGIAVVNENLENKVIDLTGISDAAGSISHTFTAAEAANYADEFIIHRNASGTGIYVNAITVEDCGAALSTHSVSFDMNGASESYSALTVKHGKKATKPADPTKAHCAFAGWVVKSTSVAYDWSAAVMADIELKATWTQLYTVGYFPGEGSGSAPAAVADKAEGETFTVAANTFTAPTGKEFDKWKAGTNYYAPGDTYTVGKANVVLTAQWKAAVAKYTVIFKDGDVTLDTKLFDVGSNPSDAGIDKTKALSTFAAWQKDDADIALDAAFWATVEKDATVTLKARWTKIYAESIDFITVAGDYEAQLAAKNYALNCSDMSKVSFDNNSNLYDKGLKIKKTGSTLSFNVEEGKVVEITTGIISGATLSVNGGAAEDLTITEKSNNSIKTRAYYSAGEQSFVITTTTDSYCIFKSISIHDPYVVTYNANGGEDVAAATYYGTALTLPSATKGTDSFLGWFDAAEGGNQIGEAGDAFIPTKDTLLYAHWEAISTDARLASITFSAVGTLSPAFDPEVTSYTYTMPYGTAAVPTITGATSVNAKAQDPIIGEAAAAWGEAQTIQGVAQSGDKKTYTITMAKAPKDGVSLIKVATTGGTNKTVTGVYAGDGDVSLSSNTKMDGGKFIGFILDGTTLQAGDKINVHTTQAANTGGSHIIFYDNMTDKNELYETGEIGGTGDNIFTINAAMVGAATAYVYRSDADAAHKWNGYVDYIEATRVVMPTLTAIKIDGRDGVIDEEHKTVAVQIPYEAVLSSLTVVPTIIRNAAHATTPEAVISNEGAWIEGANTYRVMDKDGDYTDYTITLSRDVLKHTVSFNTHGGSAVASELVVDGESLAAAPADPTKEDYIFQGWAETADGAIVDVTSFTISADKEFHAVWASDGGIKLLNGSTVNHTNFITAVTAEETVEFKGNTVNYAKFSGTVSGVNGVKDLTRVIAYNATTNKTKIQISAHNNSTSGRNILVKGLVEGADAAVDLATIALGNKEDKVSDWIEFDNAANRTIYIMVSSSAGDVYFTQVKVIESGETPMKQVGEAGYSLNLNKGRFFGLASTDLAFEGLNARLSGDYTALNSSYAKLNATSMSFTVVSDMNLVVTTNNSKTYYVTKDAAGTDNETAKTGESEFALTAGTWYITAGSSEVQFTNIAFELPKAAKPVVADLADVELCAGEPYTELTVSATKSDEGTLHYAWFKEAGETDEAVGTDAATYTPTADGEYYVIVTNTLAGHQDVSTTSDVISVAHFASVAITTAPEDVYKHTGLDATLSVVAEGKNVEYEWFTCDDEFGTNSVAIVPAQTGASLNLTNIASGIQYYMVVATDECNTSVSAVAKVEGFDDLPLQDVTGNMTWDFSKASDGTTATSDMCNEAVLVNVAGIVNNSDFKSDNIMATANKFASGKLQASMIKFHTTVAGAIIVKCSNTGNDKPDRYLMVNGVETELHSTNQTVKTYAQYVPAGDVVLTVGGDGNMFNFTSVEFKLDNDLEPARTDDWLAYGELGTICMPQGAVAVGADIYELVGKEPQYGKIVFETVEHMKPGKPYLFQAKGNRIDFILTDEAEASEPDNSGAMKGTFVDLNLTELDNVYYFADHALWSCVDLTSLSVPANRAYVKLDEVEPIASPAPAPGRRRIILGTNGTTVATGLENTEAVEAPTKMIINGQLFIIRGEKMFDATGRLVK